MQVLSKLLRQRTAVPNLHAAHLSIVMMDGLQIIVTRALIQVIHVMTTIPWTMTVPTAILVQRQRQTLGIQVRHT